MRNYLHAKLFSSHRASVLAVGQVESGLLNLNAFTSFSKSLPDDDSTYDNVKKSLPIDHLQLIDFLDFMFVWLPLPRDADHAQVGDARHQRSQQACSIVRQFLACLSLLVAEDELRHLQT